MIIGSHVSMSAPDYVLGSVKEALSYGANALMLYTGAPQNTRRKAMEELKVKEALALLDEHHIPHEHIIVHAPYIINLANCQKQETFELGVEFLRKEIERVKALGAKYLVLHPGSHVQAGEEAGLTRIVEGLDLAMENIGEVEIAIETMAGKGSELGYNFEQIRYLMEHAKHGDRLRVCMDTCHLHDAGFDVSDFDAILEAFDRVISLERLVCIHVNDSKNVRGEIGFDALNRIVHHEKLQHVVKILETPWVDGVAPYKHEIAMLKAGIFDQEIMTKLKNQE